MIYTSPPTAFVTFKFSNLIRKSEICLDNKVLLLFDTVSLQHELALSRHLANLYHCYLQESYMTRINS